MTSFDPDGDDCRTESQREWAAWAAQGYRKLYQPRSMLLAGLVFFVLFAVFLVLVLRWSGR
jgi:hypothetical protein